MTAALLVRMSSLGDIVHTFPAVTDLKRLRPEVRLHWVVEEQYLDLARMHPGADRLIPVALRRWRRGEDGAWAEAMQARRTLKETAYDAVVDSQGLLKSALVARIARRVTGAKVHGFGWSTAREPLASLFYGSTVNFAASIHKIERYRRVLAHALGYRIEGAPIDYGLVAPAKPGWAPARPYVVLLHSTARAAKLWAEAHWIELGQVLAARGLVCVLPFGSPDEEARARRIAQRVEGAEVAPPMSVVEAGGLVAAAAAVVGLDTGITHLAAALRTPVVGVFCDSEPVDAHPAGQGATAFCGGIGAPPAVLEVLHALGQVAPDIGGAVPGVARQP